MSNTRKNIVNNVGTIHEYDISNELINKKTVHIPKPDHTQAE